MTKVDSFDNKQEIKKRFSSNNKPEKITTNHKNISPLYCMLHIAIWYFLSPS